MLETIINNTLSNNAVSNKRSKQNNKSKVLPLVSVATSFFSTLLISNVALAQAADSSSGLKLEEIIVTARKREESLQDVPISITALSGKHIAEQGLTQLEGLSQTIPLFIVSENIGTDTMSIRGISSGNNFGFEQTVGQVVDGFFYGRSRLTRLDFLDVERVEILKGPQGALIGKNTTAGVINLTNARPTDEFEGWASVKYQKYTDGGGDGGIFEGAVSGPLSDSFKARLALRYENTDGWVQNPAAGRDEPVKDNWMGRLSTEWLPTDNLRVAFSWTHSEQEIEGSSVQLSNCGPGMIALVQSLNLPVRENCGNPDNVRYSLAPVNGQGNTDTSATDTNLVGLTIDWDLGGVTLTSLTGYADYEGIDDAEGDRLPIEYGLGHFEEDYEQWSQEFRLVSDTGGAFDYIVGVLIQHREQTTGIRQDILTSNCPGCGMLPPLDFSFSSTAEEESDTYAIFGQLSWHINDQWTTTIDGRFTYEEKELEKVFFPAQLRTDMLLTAFPFPLNTVFPFNVLAPSDPQAFGSHDLSLDRDEDNFSPGLTLQWEPNGDMLFYGSVRKGFKGGGYDHLNVLSQSAALAEIEYQDEEVTAYELGTKLTFADGAAQLNASIFRSEFEDIQVSTINSTQVPSFSRVSNAGAATTQGVEIDIQWLATDALKLSAALGYLDAEYDEYPDAVCYFGQTPTQGCDPGPDSLLGTGDDTQDLAGHTLANSPEWTGVLSAEYTWSLNEDLEMTAFVQGVYSGEYYSAIDLDPVLLEDEYWKVNAQITIASSDDRWEVSLIGRNITNEKTSTTGNDLPGAFFPQPAYERFLDPLRSVILRAAVRF